MPTMPSARLLTLVRIASATMIPRTNTRKLVAPRVTSCTARNIAPVASSAASESLFTDALMNKNIGLKATNEAAKKQSAEG